MDGTAHAVAVRELMAPYFSHTIAIFNSRPTALAYF